MLSRISLMQTRIICLFCAALLLGCGTSQHVVAGSRDAGVPGRDGGDAGPAAQDSGAGKPDTGVDHTDAGADGCGAPSVASDVSIYDISAQAALTSDLDASWSGVVQDLGTGTASVPSDAQAAVTSWPSSSAALSWLRITGNSGADWLLLGSELPFGFGVSKGSVVSVRAARSHTLGWGSSQLALELRVAGTLAFYYGSSGSPSSLDLPQGVTVTQGKVLCMQHDPCGDYALYALQLTVEQQSITLGTGQRARLGDYDVWHRRTAEQTNGNSQCEDWFVADSAVAITHHNPLSQTPISSCNVSSVSNLPGVHIDVDGSTCNFTLQQAMQGITFHYNVVVDADVSGVTPQRQDAGRCQTAHESGLFLGEKILGGSQNYCVCDTGLCAPQTIGPVTLKAGSYPGTFSWDGRNWNGPSDTGNPKGAAFPAGAYTFKVHAGGDHSGQAGAVEGGL